LSDGTYLSRWLDEIAGTAHLSAEVKVLLLTAARWMDATGVYSLPREDLAELLKCHPRKISEKHKAAIDAGYLARVSAGVRGRTAEFQARIPGIPAPNRVPTVGTQTPERVPTVGTQSDEERVLVDGTLSTNRVPTVGTQSPQQGADCRHPNTYTHTDAVDSDGAVVVPLFDEEKSRKNKNTKREREEPDRFDEFWAAYPRHIAKAAARKAWNQAIKKGADPEAVILGARSYAASPRRRESDIRFTAYPGSWLNGERWTDDAESEPAAAAPPRQSQSRNAQNISAARQRALDAERRMGLPPDTTQGEISQ
jgi:hypothetical protein